MSRLSPSWLRAAVLLIVCVAAGCASAARQTVKGGVQGLVEEKDSLGQLAPDIYLVARDATRGVVDGGVLALSDEERQREVLQISEELGDQIVEIAGQTTEAVGKELREEIVLTVEEVLQAATDAGDDFNPSQTAAAITRRVIDTSFARTAAGLDEHIGPAIGTMMTRDVGPAVETMLRDDIGPGVAAMLEEDIGPAIIKLLQEQVGPNLQDGVRVATKSVVLGVDDAIREIDAARAAEGDSSGGLLDRLDSLASTGKETAETGLWIVLALTIAVLAVVVFLWARARMQEKQRREQAKLANDSLLLVAQAIREAHEHDAQQSAAYRNAVKRLGQQHHHGDAFAELNRVLAKRSDLRLPSGARV